MKDSNRSTMLVVHSDLKAAEEATDVNLRAVHQLFGSVMQGSQALGFTYGVPQGVMTDVAEATRLITSARHHICRAHEQMRRVAERQSIDVTAFGDIDPTFESARDTLNVSASVT